MQNTHQAGTMKQWHTDPPPTTLFQLWNRSPILPGRERLPHPWQWPKMVWNNMRFLAMPTGLQALHSHCCCEKLTLPMAENKTLICKYTLLFLLILPTCWFAQAVIETATSSRREDLPSKFLQDTLCHVNTFWGFCWMPKQILGLFLKIFWDTQWSEYTRKSGAFSLQFFNGYSARKNHRLKTLNFHYCWHYQVWIWTSVFLEE